ncbi:hypothetical protein EJ02DRAFT_457009 [Clathrospora elynae]|uniref:BTB domain-containing protein n=1 Tax=Clathrospora elynae TaxID=706981 RepID=A0A6A5SHS6_9PLEO|nr:hypothetical protein EJ02DRAFT_457009 [Clathrospora elynae]
MASAFKSSSATLFNNPTLSDVKLKQIYQGKVREYYAHKAILCKESAFFLKAFTGKIREATEGVMKLHDDDPQHFEVLLKFIYSDKYDKDAITQLAADDKNKRVVIPIGVYAVADKYDVPKLYDPAAEDVETLLHDTDVIEGAIHAHYKDKNSFDGPIGRLITSAALGNGCFTNAVEFENLMISYPMLAADVGLYVRRSGRSSLDNLRIHRCPICISDSYIDPEAIFSYGEGSSLYCYICGTAQRMLEDW